MEGVVTLRHFKQCSSYIVVTQVSCDVRQRVPHTQTITRRIIIVEPFIQVQ